MEEGKTRVFVYGTLKRKHPNHGALESSTFLGRAYLEGPWRMINVGWFPGVVQTGGEPGKVFGEVYEVDTDTLYTLDMIEGHPNFYKRIKVETPWKKAWIYTLPPQYLDKYPVIEAGMWEPSDDEVEWAYGIAS